MLYVCTKFHCSFLGTGFFNFTSRFLKKMEEGGGEDNQNRKVKAYNIRHRPPDFPIHKKKRLE